jgi:hypothetical protein
MFLPKSCCSEGCFLFSIDRTQMQVNRRSMLGRVTKSIRPGLLRKGLLDTAGAAARSDTAVSLPSASFALPSSLPVHASLDATGPSTLIDSSGQPVDVRARPAQVIKAFVADNNIDLLVVPVPPPSTLKRLDPRNMRGASPPPPFTPASFSC